MTISPVLTPNDLAGLSDDLQTAILALVSRLERPAIPPDVFLQELLIDLVVSSVLISNAYRRAGRQEHLRTKFGAIMAVCKSPPTIYKPEDIDYFNGLLLASSAKDSAFVVALRNRVSLLLIRLRRVLTVSQHQLLVVDELGRDYKIKELRCTRRILLSRSSYELRWLRDVLALRAKDNYLGC